MTSLGGRIGLGILVAFLAVGFLAGRGAFDDDPAPARPPADRVGRYLDHVADQLAEPGALVEPGLVPLGALTREQAIALDERAQAAEAPIRLAALPAARLRVARGVPALTPEEAVAQLRDLVGADGVYAVLVRRGDGRLGLHAEQVGESGARYEVADAVAEATSCCPADLTGMLETFLDRAGDEQTTATQWTARILAGLSLLGAAVGGLWWRRRRLDAARREGPTVDLLRGPLGDEVGELGYRVAALPPVDDTRRDDLALHIRSVHALLAQARKRHRAMATRADAEQVTRLLADIRYELAVVEAFREGRPVPDRTPPCHLDPRHGPSASVEAYTPTGGTERQVPVCASCRAALEVGQRPHVRRLQRVPGAWVFYWDVGEPAAPYVAGYWPPAEPDAPDRRSVLSGSR